MKKLICVLLCLATLLSLTACGEYVEGSTATRDTLVNINPDDVDPDAQDTSTVTLMLNGMPIAENPGFYMLYLEMEIYCQWFDGHTMVVSKFDEQGVAVATGLDGDYSVTLSDVPGDYTYNINGHMTTNDNRRIELDLYRILYGDGPGTDWAYPYVKEFSDQGVYEITIDSPDQVVMCRFAPGVSGIYTIESWVSVAEDNINPQYDYWYGSVAWAQYGYTVDDGGAEGTYTKNFKDVRTVDEDEIGNVFIFGIHATAKDGQYPITVQVAVLKTGEMSDRYSKTYMVPQEVLRYAKVGAGEFVNYWQLQSNGTYLLDDTKCKLWSVEDGGDGYYHIYDEELYAAHGGWGPTLYAQIVASGIDPVTMECIGTGATIMGYSLDRIEWMGNGNNMLTVVENGMYFSYKQFIEGFGSLSSIHNGWEGSNYCVNNCPCHKDDPAPITWACQSFCETCHSLCTQVLPELYGAPGYADAVNADGLYPVTEELKHFLQIFAECQNLFCDGTGDAEAKGLASDQDSMWLWAVGYYTGDPGGECQMGEIVPNYFDKKAEETQPET